LPWAGDCRPPLAWRRVLLVVAVAGAALADAALLPEPWRGIDHMVLLAVRWPALAVLVLLLAAGAGGLALRSEVGLAPPVADREEPLLEPADLGELPWPVAVVHVAGLEPRCGVTTLTFNLAVALAVYGDRPGVDDRRRALRPACLLSEGPLSATLGLSPHALAERLAERPWDVKPDVVELGERHPSGCTLYCLPGGSQLDDSVRRLVRQLTRHYDIVLVDGGVSRSGWVSPVDTTDLLILVARPSKNSVGRAGRWLTRVWGTSLEAATVMVVNQVPAWPQPPAELLLAFRHLLLLPDEPRVRELDRKGLPWSLDDRLDIAWRTWVLALLVLWEHRIGGGPRAA
jgi:hypothetical protein